MGAGSRAVFFQDELVKRWWAQRPDPILAFEHHLQFVKWGRIVQKGIFLQGACPLYAAILSVRSVPILQVVNGIQMLKFIWALRPPPFHKFHLEENCAGPSARRLSSKTLTFLHPWYMFTYDYVLIIYDCIRCVRILWDFLC